MPLVDVFLEDSPPGSEAELIKRIAPFHGGDEEKVRRLLQTRPSLVAKDMDIGQAEQLQGFLGFLGATLRIEAAASTAGATAMNETVVLSREQVETVQAASKPGTTGSTIQRANLFHRLRFALRTAWSNSFTLLLLSLVFLLLNAASTAFILLVGNIDPAMFLGSEGFVVPAQEDIGSLVTLGGAVILAVLFQVLLWAWFLVALFRLPTLWLEQGHRTSLRDVMRDAAVRTADSASTFILASWLPALLIFVLPMAAHSLSGGDHQTVAIGFMIALGLTLLFGFAIMLLPVVTANENRSPLASMVRAWALADGLRFRLIGNLLVLYALLVIFLVLIQAIVGLGITLAVPNWEAMQNVGSIEMIMGSIVGVLAALLLGLVLLVLYSLPINVIAAFYYEARILKEGWKPNWHQHIHPSWPTLHDGGDIMENGGLTPVVRLLVISLFCLALIAGAAFVFQDQLALWAKTPLNTNALLTH